MEFIIENSTWIIIFAVILLMTLIGYIADKSNFIETRKEKEKNKKEQVEKEKKNMKTKEQQEFAAEIGDGSDLIMKENNITYPVELDRPEWKIEIPVQEKEEKEIVSENNNDGLDFSMDFSDFNNSENNSDQLVISPENEIVENNVEENEQEMANNMTDINNSYDINAPLQSGVLNLDLYDKENVEDEKDNSQNIESLSDENVDENNSQNIEQNIETNIENTQEDNNKKDSDNIEMPLPEIDSLKEVNDDDIWKF